MEKSAQKYFRYIFSGRGLALALALLIMLCIIFWKNISYQGLASRQIIGVLESKNIGVSSLEVKSINSEGAVISGIKLGDGPGLALGGLEVKYDMKGIISGKLKSLEAEDVEVNLYKKDGKFFVSGLEKFLGDGAKGSGVVTIPLDNDSLRSIVPENISVKNLDISFKDEGLELSLPMNITFNINPSAILNIESPGISLKAKPYEITTGQAKLKAELHENKKWHGNLVIPSIRIDGLDSAVALLLMNIDFELEQEVFLAKLSLTDESGVIKAAMELSFPPASPSSGILNIKQVQFPWGGGVISLGVVNVPLDMKNPILFNVNLSNVDLSDTLGKVSSGKIKGTGKISGSFPIIYNQDGTITLKDGMAQEINAGTISVSPELLPGDNAQLELARATLENFHYTKLKIIVSSAGDKSAINLALEGKNPDSASARPVNFNINLTGDIMPLIQQSVIPFNDITKLLKQEK